VRRYQADTVDLARRAKARGATIVLVTDPWQSPIAEIADRVLVVEVSSHSGSDSMVPAFALTEALIGAVLTALGDRAIARMRDLEDQRTGFEYRDENGAGARRARKRSKRHG
jgi:DNA-binding MurR/RpiR family transcriptional regulator